MIGLAVRLHRRHGWIAPVVFYVFLAAVSVLTAGLAVALLIVGGKVWRAWNGRAAA